jgi:competence protein ComEC
VHTVTHQPSFNTLPLFSLSVSFVAGILTSRALALPLALWLSCCAIFSLLALTLTLRHRHDRTQSSILLLAAFTFAGGTLAGIEEGSTAATRVRRFYDKGHIASGEPVELEGVVRRAPEWSPDGFRLTLGVERLKYKADERAATGAVELFAPVHGGSDGSFARSRYEALELRRGARLRVLVALRRAEGYRNPGVSSVKDYLERRGLDATGTIKSPLLVERLGDERVLLPLVWLDSLRSHLLARIDRLFSRETAGVLGASLLGNRENLSRSVAERFREGGTFHVLVISGLHITFIGGLALALARRLTRRRAWQFASAVLLVWGYTVAVGAEASVVRAALMFTAVALAPVLHRRSQSLNTLGGAALALLIWRPGSLFDPSFQLTFLSVFAIVAVAFPLLSKLKATGEWRPTATTPHPPVCPRWWLTLGELLFWNERRWLREISRTHYSYRLFKTPLAARLESSGAQRALRYTFAALVVSASVQVSMLPLVVVYFHHFSFASLLLNIFVGASMAALSLLSLAALAASHLSETLTAPLVWLVEQLAWVTTHSVEPFKTTGTASLRLPHYTGLASSIYVLYYVPLLVLTYALARWQPLAPPQQTEETGRPVDAEPLRATKPEPLHPPTKAKQLLFLALHASLKRGLLRFAALTLVALFIVILTHPLSAPRADGRLRVDFLDVGQGDAALLTMPDGSTLIIDGGGRPSYSARSSQEDDAESEAFERDARSIGEAVVSEYLWQRGLDAVDYVLATHADADHLDGLSDVVKNFRVRAALVARTPESDAVYRRFARTASASGAPVYLVGRGDVLKFGAVEIDVLWPPLVERDRDAPSRNDDSIVLRLRFGRKTILLTGDIEAKAETALLSARDDLGSDALKVAHHGSRTSSTQPFVAATHPSLAVISVGLDSPFGHPHPEVLRRWRASGTQILTTGQSGTITITTDGHDLKVETHIKK